MASAEDVAGGAAKARCTYFVDAHIHLADPSYKGEIEQILRDAKGKGVVAVVANSEDLDSSLATLELAERFSDLVHPAVGIHPWHASSVRVDDVERLVGYMAQYRQRLVAVGEVGLDGAYGEGRGSVEAQRWVFQRMLEAANGLRLPVMVHSRKAAEAVLDHLASYDLSGVILHWYSGPLEFLREIIQRGYYVTFGPSLTYAKHIQVIAAEMPLNLILTETDGPVQHHGIFQRVKTTPSLIPYVVGKLAEIKRIKAEEVADQIIRNAASAFPRLAPHLNSLPGLDGGRLFK